MAHILELLVLTQTLLAIVVFVIFFPDPLAARVVAATLAPLVPPLPHVAPLAPLDPVAVSALPDVFTRGPLAAGTASLCSAIN
jgi:hypothetical protein